MADYTEQAKSLSIKRGTVLFDNHPPTDINYFTINNPNKLEVDGIPFDNKSFVKHDGIASQCECVIYPHCSNNYSWICFIELKYSDKTKNNSKNLNKARLQLFKTRYYYISKGVFNKTNPCYLLASLPLQSPPFANMSLPPAYLLEMKRKHNIIIRFQNSIGIVDDKTITVEKTSINGQLKISLPSNLQFNTNIDIPIFTKNGDVTCTITLIINELNINNFYFILDNQDSENHVVDNQNPELYVGRSLNSKITYNGKSILEYGLIIEEQSIQNADVEILDDTLKLTASDVAGGSSILYSVKLKDGNTTKKYSISSNKISVFNPADSFDAIYIEDINHVKNNAITFYGPTLDLQPYYRYNDVNDSQITSKWVTTTGAYANENTVSIINTTPWDGFDIIIHYTQTYNGIEREVGQTTIKASLGFDKIVYQEYKVYGADLYVTGVDDGTGWFFGTTYHGSDSMEVSGGRVTKGFMPFFMEFQKLKDAGFSKIEINLELDIAEVQDGYQEVYFVLDDNSEMQDGYIEAFRDDSVEHTPGEKNTNWSTHTFTFEVSIDTLIQNPYFAILCGAHGLDNDTWNWGWTRMTFEALA